MVVEAPEHATNQRVLKVNLVFMAIVKNVGLCRMKSTMNVTKYVIA